jgi:hypothetical protein
MTNQRPSPYLADAQRLADVVAAIQVMATYKFYKLDFAGWADRIGGDANQAEHWHQVFDQHPEFFRLHSKRERASLVWRRQHQKRYYVDEARTITKDEFDALADTSRISRTPLGIAEIAVLMETAINLHSRALEHQRERRAWIPLVVGFVGAILGGVVAAII